MHDIFISYSRKDINYAKNIKNEIEKSCNTRCWMDMDGIESGEQFEDVIIKAIDDCKIVVFMLSENSMQSKWVKDEVRYAYETHKRVVPVRIDNSELKGWFLFKFSGLDVIMYNDENQKNKMLNNLDEWTENTKNVPQKNVSMDIPSTEKLISAQSTKDYIYITKKKQPYFYSCVKWGTTIQIILFAIIAVVLLWTLFAGAIGKNYGIRLEALSLVATSLIIIGCTVFIKKYPICKWSFIVLDFVALFLFISIGRDVYLVASKYHIQYTTMVYRMLYNLGLSYHRNVVNTWMYFVPLYILHNACVLVIMNSRRLWYKLPYKIRRITKWISL